MPATRCWDASNLLEFEDAGMISSGDTSKVNKIPPYLPARNPRS